MLWPPTCTDLSTKRILLFGRFQDGPRGHLDESPPTREAEVDPAPHGGATAARPMNAVARRSTRVHVLTQRRRQQPVATSSFPAAAPTHPLPAQQNARRRRRDVCPDHAAGRCRPCLWFTDDGPTATSPVHWKREQSYSHD